MLEIDTSFAIFWLRRDLRLNDNAGLYHALRSEFPVLPIFIFDKNILEHLPRNDARVTFLHSTIANLQQELYQLGSDIAVFHSTPAEVFSMLSRLPNLKKVFCNKDYEPYAKERDILVADILNKEKISFHSFKDHVIFEGHEVVKSDGSPYTVFTPYKRKWMETLYSRQSGDGVPFYLKSYPTEKYFKNFLNRTHIKRLPKIPDLKNMGFEKSSVVFPPLQVSQSIIKNYDKTRNFPAINGTSKLGIHFRFGTISIREKALKSISLNETYLSELIWRDFYSMILQHFPHVAHRAFKPTYDKIEWLNNEKDFEKWKNGMTGYPIVDAGMRELNATGYMHNRVRMITASFLTKHLLIDWRWGEAYFAEKLLDFDLASNNGGWQWAAGSGTDAAPYFRIFSPASQQEKFDPQMAYIKKWIPEYGTSKYPKPMIDHKFARDRCLQVYKKALS